MKILLDIDSRNSFDDQVKWEYLKFEIQKFTILYSKILTKNNRKIKNDLEIKLKDLENDLSNYNSLQNTIKLNLNLGDIQ